MAVTAIGTAPRWCLRSLTSDSPRQDPPVGDGSEQGSASDGTTATQTDFEVDVTPPRRTCAMPGLPVLRNSTRLAPLRGARPDGGCVGPWRARDRRLVPDHRRGHVQGLWRLGALRARGARDRDRGHGRERLPAALCDCDPDGYLHAIYQNHTSGNGILGYRHRPPSTELWEPSGPLGRRQPESGDGVGGYIGDPTIWWVRTNDDPGYRIFVAAWFATSTSSRVLRISQSPDRG